MLCRAGQDFISPGVRTSSRVHRALSRSPSPPLLSSAHALPPASLGQVQQAGTCPPPTRSSCADSGAWPEHTHHMPTSPGAASHRGVHCRGPWHVSGLVQECPPYGGELACCWAFSPRSGRPHAFPPPSDLLQRSRDWRWVGGQVPEARSWPGVGAGWQRGRWHRRQLAQPASQLEQRSVRSSLSHLL